MSTKPQHSSYWLDQDVFDDDELVAGPGRDDTLVRLMRLAAIRRGISNFVNILTNRNDIKVEFSSGKNSYTDGSTVVIAADEDPSKFDPMVGLALHEASHIKLSNFEFLKNIKNIENNAASGYMTLYWGDKVYPAGNFVADNILHPALVKKTHTYELDKRPHVIAQMMKDLQVIMNVLEDRRIDKYVYQNAPGYRPYYIALYNKYFFTGEVGKNLRFNPKWRELTVDNYINRLIYFFHPANKMDAMPGMEKLYKLMDINTIERVGDMNDDKWKQSCKFEDMPQLWTDANIIYAHILKFVELGQVQNEPNTAEKTETSNEDMPSDLPNLDIPPASEFVPSPVEEEKKGKPGKFNEKKAENEMKKAQQVINDEVNKKKVSKTEAQAISAIEQAQADMVDITGDGIKFGRCIVMRKLTDQVLEQEWYPFRSYWKSDRQDAAIAAGRRMGAILAQRLQVRNDPLFTKQTRLPQGNIDRRLLAQLGMDIEQVFHKSRVDMHKPAMLHLTLDASGSMSGDKWHKVVAVAVALAYVGSKIRNIDTVISMRGGDSIPIVSVIFDSRRDQFNTAIRHFRKVGAAGATPEGLCFKATLDLVLECADTHDVYFINFSDGEPSFAYDKRSTLSGEKSKYAEYVNYSGEFAFKHTRTMINRIKEHGVKVLSYFITEDNYTRTSYSREYTAKAFKYMYGENAQFVNVQNVSEVLRTLNNTLLKRGT